MNGSHKFRGDECRNYFFGAGAVGVLGFAGWLAELAEGRAGLLAGTGPGIF